jgi:hypothetical protein
LLPLPRPPVPRSRVEADHTRKPAVVPDMKEAVIALALSARVTAVVLSAVVYSQSSNDDYEERQISGLK